MSRYIDADAIDYKHFLQHVEGEFNFELLDGADNLIDAFYAGFMYLHERIEETPTADVRENVHGEWIVTSDCEGKTRKIICPICKWESGKYQWYNLNFCPNCGAEMKGENDD